MKKNEKCKKQKRRLSKDERGVSPVVGVIMMVAITVVIAAVVAAFAYGIIGGVKKAPNAALVLEGAVIDSHNISIIHHGGDPISRAFNGSFDNTSGSKGAWNNMEIRINGSASGTYDLTLNGDPLDSLGSENLTVDWGTTKFSPGDQLDIGWTGWNLTSDDSIAIVYIPSGDLLQRVVVV